MVPRLVLACLLLSLVAVAIPPAAAACTYVGGVPGTADVYRCKTGAVVDLGGGCMVVSGGATSSSGPGTQSRGVAAGADGPCMSPAVGVAVSDTTNGAEGTTCVTVQPGYQNCWTRTP